MYKHWFNLRIITEVFKQKYCFLYLPTVEVASCYFAMWKIKNFRNPISTVYVLIPFDRIGINMLHK